MVMFGKSFGRVQATSQGLELTTRGMVKGVHTAQCFLLLLTKGVFGELSLFKVRLGPHLNLLVL
jgi:hypothetical protein